jgi:hypothetical protein
VPLGIGFGQVARDSQLTVIRSIHMTVSLGKNKNMKTGVAWHQELAKQKELRAQRIGYTVREKLEIGMCLLSINKISTAPMSYDEIIVSLKNLPKPIELEFGILEHSEMKDWYE